MSIFKVFPEWNVVNLSALWGVCNDAKGKRGSPFTFLPNSLSFLPALDLLLPLGIDDCYATQATWIVLISSIFGGDWDDLNDHMEQAYMYHL